MSELVGGYRFIGCCVRLGMLEGVQHNGGKEFDGSLRM